MSKQKDYREMITTPFETKIRNFPSIAKYFLYYAPCIESARSQGQLSEPEANKLLNDMLASTHIDSKTKILKQIQKASWRKLSLDGYYIDFETPRILIERYNKETELQALLRHIRNSLAHGYLYVWKKKQEAYILFVDYSSKKDHKRETGKVLVTMRILEEWKAILENHIS